MENRRIRESVVTKDLKGREFASALGTPNALLWVTVVREVAMKAGCKKELLVLPVLVPYGRALICSLLHNDAPSDS